MERRNFTREFKLEAVKLIKERGVGYARASPAHDRCQGTMIKLLLRGTISTASESICPKSAGGELVSMRRWTPRLKTTHHPSLRDFGFSAILPHAYPLHGLKAGKQNLTPSGPL
jgi:hypothetical protein